jgi:hypothetical protein
MSNINKKCEICTVGKKGTRKTGNRKMAIRHRFTSIKKYLDF